MNLEKNEMNLITKAITLLISVFTVSAASRASAASPTTLRTHDNPQNAVVLYDSAKTPAVPNRVAAQSIAASRMPADTICNLESRVEYGDPAPSTGAARSAQSRPSSTPP